MRGLKQFCKIYPWSLRVASFTDAWIETLKCISANEDKRVASFTDAWIETFSDPPNANVPISRIFYRCVDWNLLLVVIGVISLCRIFYRCVDWNRNVNAYQRYLEVASFTDAWIETDCTEGWSSIYESHLLQMRGLKHRDAAVFKLQQESHLLQMRGLKHTKDADNRTRYRRIFYRCVDWNISSENTEEFVPVASFTDAWIET